jgi:hypothetical protein
MARRHRSWCRGFCPFAPVVRARMGDLAKRSVRGEVRPHSARVPIRATRDAAAARRGRSVANPREIKGGLAVANVPSMVQRSTLFGSAIVLFGVLSASVAAADEEASMLPALPAPAVEPTPQAPLQAPPRTESPGEEAPVASSPPRAPRFSVRPCVDGGGVARPMALRRLRRAGMATRR